MKFRMLGYEDFEAASQVLWKSFYEAEKNVCSMDGMEYFRDLTSPVSLSINLFGQNIVPYGVFSPELVAVGAIKDDKHILLAYVHPDHQKKGIGSALLAHLESKCKEDVITLNASDGAISFYEKRGYVKMGRKREEKGLIFTPMKKETEK